MSHFRKEIQPVIQFLRFLTKIRGNRWWKGGLFGISDRREGAGDINHTTGDTCRQVQQRDRKKGLPVIHAIHPRRLLGAERCATKVLPTRIKGAPEYQEVR